MKADALTGMAVLSIASGARLGRVEDIAFDTSTGRLAALRVEADGQHALIPYTSIHAVGKDAITVPSDDVAQWTKPEGALASMPGLDAFKKMKVVDEAGTYLGMVKQVEIDPASGQITHVSTHEGGVLGLGGTTRTISAAEIRSVGNDVVLVSPTATAPPKQ